MLEKLTADAMAARIKAYTPSVNNVSVERTETGNAIMKFSDFFDNESLQLGLNLASQYFTPLKSRTNLGSLETEAEIGFQLRPTALTMSTTGTLQQLSAAGTTVELTGLNLVAFAEHILSLYRFWFTSPAFRGRAHSYFSNSPT